MEDAEIEMCSLCGPIPIHQYNHKGSVTHNFNFMLLTWNKYRKKVVQDSHNVAVSVRLVDFINGTRLKYEQQKNKGCCIVKATVAQATIQNTNGINYLFTVRNTHTQDSVILSKIYLLHPDPSYKLVQVVDSEDLHSPKKILPGATYSVKIQYLPTQVSVGSFKMPVMMNFQTWKNETFSIGRELVIIVSDEDELSTIEINKKSPFTSVTWEKSVTTWVEAEGYKKFPEFYIIPRKWLTILKFGLQEYTGMNGRDFHELEVLREQMSPDYPTIDNYADFFHVLLWLDEIGAGFMLKRYNMENVTMTRFAGDFLELEVPGLAEKRPSLIVRDVVNMRLHGDHIAYRGIIQCVKDKSVWISSVDTELTEYIEDNQDAELDISFKLGRLNYERMHYAIDRCVRTKVVECLFPDDSFTSTLIKKFHIQNTEFFNQDIVNNQEQKRTVLNILNCTSGKAPYIVFGPPGTGKTITIVEAILQIKKLTSARILLCAPANAACDWVAEKLIKSSPKQQIGKNDMLRLHSASRDWSSVPEAVRLYSNYLEGTYFIPTDADLLKYRIIISTLMNIGRYTFNQTYHPDFVFIDEAAQAMEPEAIIPLSLLVPGKQIVLAGDPKQLGPLCSSAVAEKLNLSVSLLERLMTMPFYKNEDPNFITMLKLNFRAHPVVLQLPNELFYHNQLQAVSRYALTDPIAKIFIYSKIYNRPSKLEGNPVEFCSVIAKERREGNSPSYFNEKEIEMVMKYVCALLSLQETKVDQQHIGIVTPYIRQVYRIKEKLKQYGYLAIEVGTAESFQGREKRIVIVSTVRAQHSLLLYDKKYGLGFVKNEKRFNVALTRAISKLIVIGCPNVLRYDKKCWLRYIDFCVERCSYFGGTMDRRTEPIQLEVINRMNNIKEIKKIDIRR